MTTAFSKFVAALLSVGTAFVWWVSSTGAGVPPPTKNPPSIREDSTRPVTARHRTRYFVGGGVLRGK